MENAVATKDDGGKLMEAVILHGDLSKLTSAERVLYYTKVCDSLGLNPLTQPFAYIKLSGKEVLYAKRDATDQLRKRYNVSIADVQTQRIEDVYVVTAKATMPDGRTDTSTGAVPIKGLSGDALANALMKAETKSKRRVTLSIVGLGWLDESELETIHDTTHAKPKTLAAALMTKPVEPAPTVEQNAHPQQLPVAEAPLEPAAMSDHPAEAPPPVRNGILVWEGCFGSLDEPTSSAAPHKLHCFDSQEERVFDTWGEPTCLKGVNLKLLVGHPVRVDYQIRENTGKNGRVYKNMTLEHLELITDEAR